MTRLVFASNLRKLRRRKGLSITDAARDLGISWKRFAAWEDAVCYPKMAMLVKVCDYFDYKDIYNLLTTPID